MDGRTPDIQDPEEESPEDGNPYLRGGIGQAQA
jgi:hypothetical protein